MGDTNSLRKEDFWPAMVWHVQYQGQQGISPENPKHNPENGFSYSNTYTAPAKNERNRVRPWSVLNGLARGFKPYEYTHRKTCHPSEPYDNNGLETMGTRVNARQRLRLMWERFGNNTTLHGVKQIEDNTRGTISRFIWFILVCAMAVTLCSTVGKLFIEYYEYNTVTKSEIKIVKSWPFPSVTVCSLCPFNKHEDTSPTTQYLDRYFAKSSVLNWTYEDMRLNVSDPIFQKMLQMRLDEIYDRYSYRLTDFIISATYNGEALNISKRFETTETTEGRCFTFNGPQYIKDNNITMSAEDGHHSGLRFFANLNQDNYFVYGDVTAGIKVYISHHPQTPRMKNEGVDIHPGTATRLAIHPVTYSFLPKPYKSYGDQYCEKLPERDVYNKLLSGTFYSYERCIDQCSFSQATYKCSCSLVGLDVVGYNVCTLGQFNDCIAPFAGAFYSESKQNCDCPRPCTFTKYDITTSASQMPSKVSEKYLAKRIGNYKKYNSTLNFRDNFVDVRVHLDSLLTTTVRHEPQFTLESVVAALGGQMGFFLGASLLTMAELAETLIETAYVFFTNKVFKLGQVGVTPRNS